MKLKILIEKYKFQNIELKIQNPKYKIEIKIQNPKSKIEK